MKLRKLLTIIFALTFFSVACVHMPPGQIKKETTPGHMKKHLEEHPGKGK